MPLSPNAHLSGAIASNSRDIIGGICFRKRDSGPAGALSSLTLCLQERRFQEKVR